MPRLGVDKNGYQILASCCAEDNSGHVIQEMGMFTVHCSYPITEDSQGNPVHKVSFATKEKAIAELRSFCGYEQE